MDAPNADQQEVSGAILHEIQGVMGLGRHRWAAGLVGALFGPAARCLAGQLIRLDDEVARYGLVAAAGNLLAGLIHAYRIDYPEAIPWQGPLLIASNHPGAYDLLILAVSLGREDLKVIRTG